MNIALITGATSKIGTSTAIILAKAGYVVCLNGRNEKKLNEIKKKINQAGYESEVFIGNISEENEIIKIFHDIKQKLGQVNALVNNASITTYTNSVSDITSENYKKIFDINTLGTFLCCREAINHMKEAGGGAIVNMSSEAARFGGNNMSLYASSKAAINTFTIGIAREIASFNIRINAVSPGVIDTDAHNHITQDRKNFLLNSIPMKRMGTPDEVAELILWLLSDKASYITGAVIPVTGGR